jgi:hypothetical protein
MDRQEAEKIVSRDLPGIIAKMLKGLPFKPPDGLAKQIYDSAAPTMVADLLDGTMQFTPEGRLTFELVQASGKLSFKLTDALGNSTTL